LCSYLYPLIYPFNKGPHEVLDLLDDAVCHAAALLEGRALFNDPDDVVAHRGFSGELIIAQHAPEAFLGAHGLKGLGLFSRPVAVELLADIGGRGDVGEVLLNEVLDQLLLGSKLRFGV